MGYPFDIPARPAHGAKPWDLESQFGAVQSRMRELEHGVSLDSFTGATDDDKLTAALAYAAAQTFKPAILLGSRQYNFSTQRQLFSGLRIVGPPGSYDQDRSGFPIAVRVRLSITGGGAWWTIPTGNTFAVNFARLSCSSGNGSSFLAPNAASNLWTSVFDCLAFSGLTHIFGNETTFQPMTACSFTGWWNVNNALKTSFYWGGSDNQFWNNTLLLDSPTSLMGAASPPTYHMRWASMSKSPVGPLYITAEGNSSGMRITGSNVGNLSFNATRVEGRNAGAPCNGALIRVDANTGHGVDFFNCWLSYAMADPGATGRDDGGVIHVSGGHVLLSDCWYAKATTVAESTPFVYATGAGTKVTVRNLRTGRNQAWSSLPRVQAVNGATIVADSSVTVI